ncbi:MAG: hypothetical protein ABIG34_05420, partial [Candidatus Peregrinibacteria bacterium]
ICDFKSGDNYDLGASFYDPSCVCCDKLFTFSWNNATNLPPMPSPGSSAWMPSGPTRGLSLYYFFL